MIKDSFISDYEGPDSQSEDNIASDRISQDVERPDEGRLPFISDYSALERLNSEGSTCETYKWVYRSHVYFVKRLKPTLLYDSQSLCAFEKEYELGSRLSHPSLPRYIDYRRTKNDCYIVMEYVDGKTLTDLWHNPVTANREMTYTILHQLIDVLEYLHRNNVVHYDLLPQNVMLTTGLNNVVLIDLDKAYNYAYINSDGDASRFVEDQKRYKSTDTDFRALAMILKKGLWGGYEDNELKHFCDLCMTPGVTHSDLRSALTHIYDDLTMKSQPVVSGQNCDCYEGEWKLKQVFVKKLKSEFIENDYYLRKMRDEYEWLYDVSGRPLTMPMSLMFRQTSDSCYIVIEKFDGLSLTKMIADHHPWLQDPKNIKLLIDEFLDLLEYLWQEGNDYVDYDTDDIFIEPECQYITFANLGDILDVRVSELRLNHIIERHRDVNTGEVTEHKVYTTPFNRVKEFPMMCRLISKLEIGGVDVKWLASFRQACYIGATSKELHESLISGWQNMIKNR